MKRFLLSLLLLFSVWTQADTLLSADKAFSFKAKVVNDDILLSWDIARGYYLYKEKIGISANLSQRLGQAEFPVAKIKNDDFFGTIGTYRKNVIVRVPVLPGTEKSIALTVSYQGCADIGVCYPPIKKTSVLSIKATEPVSVVNTALDILAKAQSQAQSMFASVADAGPLQPDKAFKLTALSAQADTLKVIWDILPKYYLYHDKISFDVQGAKLGNVALPKGKIKDDPIFGKVEIHKNRLEVDIPLRNVTGKSVDLTAHYQGCWEGGVCYPPQQKTLSIPLFEEVVEVAEVVKVPQIKAPEPSATIAVADPIIATPAPVVFVEPELTQTEQIVKSIQGKDIYSILFFFFIAGLGAAFTSCILPMIPILSAIIIGQQQKVSTKKAFAMSLVFVIFMSLAYALIGVLFAKSGEQIQIVLQNPWVLGGFGLIFVALALSMFGYFEIKLPNALQNKLTQVSNKQKGGSFIGVAIMGFLSALIVGPCSAPILSAALLYIAQSNVDNTWFGASALFALGMGMGLPLIIAGIGVSMPKPGAWMDKVKQVFGVIMLGMAIYFVQRVLPDNISLILWALLLTIAPIAMGALEGAATSWTRIFKAIGLIILAYGILLLGLVARGGGDMFAPLAGNIASSTQAQQAHVTFKPIKSSQELDQELMQAKQNNQTVVLDFYADWCISCKELERFVFSNPEVVGNMQNVIALQADVTKNNADDKALMRRFNLVGPPAILFFKDGTEKRAQRVVGEINAQDFVMRLNKAQ